MDHLASVALAHAWASDTFSGAVGYRYFVNVSDIVPLAVTFSVIERITSTRKIAYLNDLHNQKSRHVY
ncbi:MAG: hypothetical protein QOH42_2536 [Blastocatellia bacterium]|nr:hypothetical protein [Blastocatellia bacterium]